MLYLIEHDPVTDNPKTRWGQLSNDILESIEQISIFCSCIDYIDDIYIHDHKGNIISLKSVCDHYHIKYKEKKHDNNN